jgi:hypothetical protein
MIDLNKERTATEMSIVHREVYDRGEEKNLGIAEGSWFGRPNNRGNEK